MNDTSRSNLSQLSGPRGWNSRAAAAAVLLAASLLGSCLVEHHVRPVPTDEMLPWLRPGTTSRGELLQILGTPRRSLEGGRILIWELLEDGFQTHRADDAPVGPFSLVVVVQDEHVQRASLVRLWL